MESVNRPGCSAPIRTWSNYEGVNGLEQMKWSPESYDMVTYDVTFPFIRMLAGPVDYTQGAMRNAIRQNYRPVNSEPMSQGTRCRQLATYVIFESPLNMLCDNPTNYMREKECTGIYSSYPHRMGSNPGARCKSIRIYSNSSQTGRQLVRRCPHQLGTA